MIPKRFLVLTAVASLAVATTTHAGQIDLRLALDYTGGAPGAGGAWTLFAETDEFGLSSLIVSHEGINPSVVSELPVGRVNGSATNNAGFSTFQTQSILGSRQITAAQVVQPQGSQQGIFYGVGTLANGSPNFPGRQPGTSFLGPNITTLTGLQNAPWGNSDPFSAAGVEVASGTFAAGSIPGFSEDGLLAGSLLSSIGSANTPGDRTLDVSISTLITDNLTFGVATGDYNADGRVDAADYTVWRDTLSDTVTPSTGADGNGDGQITLQDRAIWEANYGRLAPAGAVAVPEPANFSLALLALSACSRRRVSRLAAGKTAQSGVVA